MVKVPRKFKAWLVTWEWMGNHAKRDDKIVAVFDPRMTPAHIQELVELLYLNLVYGIHERVYYALHRRKNPCTAKCEYGEHRRWPPMIHCGHNPFLTANLVESLGVERHEDSTETATWQNVRSKRWHTFTSKKRNLQ